MNKNEGKSRHLPLLEYIKALEFEWWICSFRRKIYPSKNDKKHYTNVSLLKRDRIIDMSERNLLPHIFNDSDKMRELNKRLSPVSGCPEFEGRVDKDVLYYYMVDSDVRCFYGFDSEKKPIIKLGKIISFDFISQKVEVNIESNRIENLPISCVTRIF